MAVPLINQSMAYKKAITESLYNNSIQLSAQWLINQVLADGTNNLWDDGICSPNNLRQGPENALFQTIAAELKEDQRLCFCAIIYTSLQHHTTDLLSNTDQTTNGCLFYNPKSNIFVLHWC